MRCLACKNDNGNRTFVAREMMYGSREPFDYLECAQCGSLQIVKTPDNLARYYGDTYYSFADPQVTRSLRFLKQRRNEGALGKRTPLVLLLYRLYGPPEFAEWIQTVGLGAHDAILDVGCGAGHLLEQLRVAGFDNLTGIDPFLRGDPELNGVRLRKMHLREVEGQFDFIMLHHSFEHMSNPAKVLAEIHRLLKPGCSALVRCPVAGSYAWRTYGTDWVQLDAPRHHFIPSRIGFDCLAKTSGLQLWKVTCDSTEFQFEGSELYRRGIPLNSSRRKDFFPRSKMREFKRLAAELNETSEGDSACFYLCRPVEKVAGILCDDLSVTAPRDL